MTMPNHRRSVFWARFRWVGVVAILGGVFGAFCFAEARFKKEEPNPTEPRPSPSPGVGAIGRLEPGWKIYQVAPLTSSDRPRIETLSVKEGDWVKCGDLIATLDNHTLRQTALEEAKAQVEISQARLALVQAGAKPEEIAAQAATVDQLKASHRRSEADFKRAELMNRGGALSAEEFDQKLTQTQIVRANLRQAEATLAALKSVRPEDVSVARAELAKAKAGVGKAQAELENTLVRAPIPGRILKIHARPGEKIDDSGLVEIGDTEDMHAVAEVYERDIPRVKLGQNASVWLQSLKQELRGQVIHIGWKVGRKVVLDNDPVKDTDARVVEVRIRLNKESSALVAGLSNARIEVRIDVSPTP